MPVQTRPLLWLARPFETHRDAFVLRVLPLETERDDPNSLAESLFLFDS